MFVRDCVIKFERLILLAEFFDNTHVLTHDISYELRGTAQLGADKDKAFAEVTELLTFHIHRVAFLVRLNIVLHHEGAKSFKFNLVDVWVVLKQAGELLTDGQVSDICDWYALITFFSFAFLCKIYIVYRIWIRCRLIRLNHLFIKNLYN